MFLRCTNQGLVAGCGIWTITTSVRWKIKNHLIHPTSHHCRASALVTSSVIPRTDC